MSSPQIKAVLLDIGNVLLKINWNNSLKFLKLSPSEIERFMNLGQSELFHHYEAGLLSCDEFRKELNLYIKKEITLNDFHNIWCACFNGEMEGQREILWKASEKVPLYTLSNTNESHYQYFKNFDLFQPFTELLTSHKFKCRKPNPEIYLKAIERLNFPADQILFIDDLEENLESARKLGIHSEYCYQSSTRLRSIFAQYGLI